MKSEPELRVPKLQYALIYTSFFLSFFIQLNSNDDTPVKYIITTCMDPWVTSLDFMDHVSSVMRNTILCAIGRVRANLIFKNL